MSLVKYENNVGVKSSGEAGSVAAACGGMKESEEGHRKEAEYKKRRGNEVLMFIAVLECPITHFRHVTRTCVVRFVA